MNSSIKFGLLTRITGYVALTIDQADEYRLYLSDKDNGRIIEAILNDRRLLTFPVSEVKRWMSEKSAQDNKIN